MLFWSILTFIFIGKEYTTSDTSTTSCEDYPKCFSVECQLFNRTVGNCACSSIVLVNNKIDEIYICEYKESHFNSLFLIVIFLYYLIFLVILCLLYYLIKFTYDTIVKNRRLKYLSDELKFSKK